MLRAIAFDFDGVLVESVEVKTRAFARLFASETPEVVERIVRYHRQQGGISRFEKFAAIYRDILKRPLSEEMFQWLCEQFSQLVVEEIVAAPWAEGAREFVTRYHGRYRFFVVSGTPHEELTDIMTRRGMAQWFDEVVGSPKTKEVLLREVMSRCHLQPAEIVFIGDAESDWLAARQVGISFIWRRTSDQRAELPGFSGPAIPSLVDLEACLSTFGARRAGQRARPR